MKRVIGPAIFIILIAAAFVIISHLEKLKEEQAVSELGSGAVLLFLEGDVKVKTSASEEWIDAEEEMVLLEGYSMRTRGGSWAELRIGEGMGNLVKVKENSRIDFVNLGPIEIGLLKGEIRALVEGLDEGSTFEVSTPTATCGARGTGWDTATDGEEVTLDVYESQVLFNRLSREGDVVESTLVGAGNRMKVIDPDTPIVRQPLPLDRRRDWYAWKEDIKERLGLDEEPDIELSESTHTDEERRVWIEEEEDGDYQLMIKENE